MVDINTTPLIDVMLVLLIMLIITIPIQTHAVKLNMPTNQAAPPPTPPVVVNIDVDFDGTICGMVRWCRTRTLWNTSFSRSLSRLISRSASAAQQAGHLQVRRHGHGFRSAPGRSQDRSGRKRAIRPMNTILKRNISFV